MPFDTTSPNDCRSGAGTVAIMRYHSKFVRAAVSYTGIGAVILSVVVIFSVANTPGSSVERVVTQESVTCTQPVLTDGSSSPGQSGQLELEVYQSGRRVDFRYTGMAGVALDATFTASGRQAHATTRTSVLTDSQGHARATLRISSDLFTIRSGSLAISLAEPTHQRGDVKVTAPVCAVEFRY